MSSAITQEKANLAKDAGVFKKLFAGIQKLFAKEFLWIVFVLVLGLPMGLTITYLIQNWASPKVQSAILEIIHNKPLFIACYLFSLVGIYFTRTVIGAIEMMVNKSKG